MIDGVTLAVEEVVIVMEAVGVIVTDEEAVRDVDCVPDNVGVSVAVGETVRDELAVNVTLRVGVVL